MKIKEKVINLLNILRKSIEKFPVTTISIFVLTAIYTICIGNKWADWDVINRIATFIAIFASTTFLIETLSKERKKSQIIYYVLGVIWSAISTISLYIESSVFWMSNELFVHLATRVVWCYIISIIILSVYYNFKKSEKEFGRYLTDVVVSMFKTSLIYGILAIGLAIVASIFIYLILNGRHYILLGRIEILLLGIYYVPTIIYSLYSQEGEIGKFAKVVIKYVLGTLVMIAFAIIYIYILKILILRDIPSNQIFRILAALFVIGLPIWTMCSSLNEGKTFDKINDKMPLLFIPFIFLQMYSIGVRIGENGLTEARYLCVILIIFEIIYTIIYIKNKSKVDVNLIVMVALIVISTMAPFINMFKLSAINQYSILKKYDQKDDLSKEEKSKLYGAYYYLESSVVGKKYVENYKLQETETDKDFSYPNESKINIYLRTNSNFIRVEGYSKLYNIRSYFGTYINDEKDYKKLDEAFRKVTFEIDDSEDTINVNMLNVVKKYIQNKNELNKNFDKVNEIIIDDNKKIILDNISISYNEITEELYSYSLIGYLLVK